MVLDFFGFSGQNGYYQFWQLSDADRGATNVPRLRVELSRHLDSLSADYYDKTPIGAIVYP